MKIVKLGIAALTLAASVVAPAMAKEVNVYSNRQAYLLEPVLKPFEEQTGYKVNVVFAKSGLAERLAREGRFSRADLVMTTDISRLLEFVERDLVQPVDDAELEQRIPAQYRDPDDRWFALTLRVRNIFTAKTLDGTEQIRYEDLGKPAFKGKICTRSGKHPYNVALIASMVAHHGEAWTRDWLKDVKANLARKPQGNDRAQVRAVKEGLCDVALGNSYYYGLMLTNDEQRPWAEAVDIRFPNQAERGAHVNVSGMALTKHAPNREAAIELMHYLASEQAQQIYAATNYEYPVTPAVPASELVASWGDFKPDSLAVSEIARHRTTAMKLLDEVKFDL